MPEHGGGRRGRGGNGAVRRLLWLAWLPGLVVAWSISAQQGVARCDDSLRESFSGLRGHHSLPCEQATVSPRRRSHILDGDASGGGHRPGRGIPNKSEFPSDWSDDRIIGMIEDIANDPASTRRREPDGRTVATGRRQGVEIRVVIDRDGRSIVTGYPTNTPRNPR
jgi:Bacterial EndoU nuclease